MGNIKNRIIEKIKIGDQAGKEATDEGKQIDRDGREIKELLNGINTSMDEDDQINIADSIEGIKTDVQVTFQGKVEKPTTNMETIETEAIDSATEELDKVSDAADRFKTIEGISEIGRSNARSAGEKMEGSAFEYKDRIEEAMYILDNTKKDVENLKSSIDDIWR